MYELAVCRSSFQAITLIWLLKFIISSSTWYFDMILVVGDASWHFHIPTFFLQSHYKKKKKNCPKRDSDLEHYFLLLSRKRTDTLEDTTCGLCQTALLMTSRHTADLLADSVSGAQTKEQVCYHTRNSVPILALRSPFPNQAWLPKTLPVHEHGLPTFWSITVLGTEYHWTLQHEKIVA